MFVTLDTTVIKSVKDKKSVEFLDIEKYTETFVSKYKATPLQLFKLSTGLETSLEEALQLRYLTKINKTSASILFCTLSDNLSHCIDMLCPPLKEINETHNDPDIVILNNEFVNTSVKLFHLLRFLTYEDDGSLSLTFSKDIAYEDWKVDYLNECWSMLNGCIELSLVVKSLIPNNSTYSLLKGLIRDFLLISEEFKLTFQEQIKFMHDCGCWNVIRENSLPDVVPGTILAKKIITKNIRVSDNQYVTGVVLEPDVRDLQNQEVSKETIKEIMFKYMISYQNGKSLLGEGHTNFNYVKGQDYAIVENYQVPADITIEGTLIKDGTWVMTVKLINKELYKKVLQGELNGFSIGGPGLIMPD
jgi:hypothetical protein